MPPASLCPFAAVRSLKTIVIERLSRLEHQPVDGLAYQPDIRVRFLSYGCWSSWLNQSKWLSKFFVTVGETVLRIIHLSIYAGVQTFLYIIDPRSMSCISTENPRSRMLYSQHQIRSQPLPNSVFNGSGLHEQLVTLSL